MINKNVTAIILAGGKSSRMGSDKAFIKIGGNTIIERIIETLKYLFADVIIAANELEKFKGFNVQVVKDIKPNCGPLSGIHSGLVNSQTHLNFIVACDMPFLQLELIRFVISKADGYDGVVPNIDGRIETLHAIYSKHLMPLFESSIEGGDYALHKILRKANINFLDFDEFKVKNYCLGLRNVNTKDDLVV